MKNLLRNSLLTSVIVLGVCVAPFATYAESRTENEAGIVELVHAAEAFKNLPYTLHRYGWKKMSQAGAALVAAFGAAGTTLASVSAMRCFAQLLCLIEKDKKEKLVTRLGQPHNLPGIDGFVLQKDWVKTNQSIGSFETATRCGIFALAAMLSGVITYEMYLFLKARWEERNGITPEQITENYLVTVQTI